MRISSFKYQPFGALMIGLILVTLTNAEISKDAITQSTNARNIVKVDKRYIRSWVGYSADGAIAVFLGTFGVGIGVWSGTCGTAIASSFGWGKMDDEDYDMQSCAVGAGVLAAMAFSWGVINSNNNNGWIYNSGSASSGTLGVWRIMRTNYYIRLLLFIILIVYIQKWRMT